MRVLDVQMNTINGGSFTVTTCKAYSSLKSTQLISSWMLRQEDEMGIDTPKPYRDFEETVFKHRKHL